MGKVDFVPGKVSGGTFLVFEVIIGNPIGFRRSRISKKYSEESKSLSEFYRNP